MKQAGVSRKRLCGARNVLTPALTLLRAVRLHADYPCAFARDSTCVYAELETYETRTR